MCMFCCGARGPHGLVCNNRVGHPGTKHMSFLGRLADEDQSLVLEWEPLGDDEKAEVVSQWN